MNTTKNFEGGGLVSSMSAHGVESRLPGVFYPFTISPEVAAIAMLGSSALVAINALMLKRTRLAGIRRVHAGDSAAQVTPATGAVAAA